MIKIVLYETLTDKQGFFALSTEKNYFSKDESISELLNIPYEEYKKRLNDTFVVVNQDNQMYVKFDDTKDKMVERFKNEFAAEMVLAEVNKQWNRIDYYIPSLNITIEYDENGHASYKYEEREGRQKEIEKELGCKFIRVTDKEFDEYHKII